MIWIIAKYWFAMTVAGFLGFAIGIVTVMQITITSPLTHNISGTAKACVQTVLALMIFDNETTVNAMLGVLMTVLGSAFYAYVRLREEEASKQQKAPAPVPLTTVTVDSSAEKTKA
jgi:GDP-fucose transporter C1